MSSAETEEKKPAKPKPVARYFGALKDEENSKDVQRIPVNIKKKAKSFEGDVIQVEAKAKRFDKTVWQNRKGMKKHFKNRKPVQLSVDPYALQRHSREYFKFSEGYGVFRVN